MQGERSNPQRHHWTKVTLKYLNILLIKSYRDHTNHKEIRAANIVVNYFLKYILLYGFVSNKEPRLKITKVELSICSAIL